MLDANDKKILDSVAEAINGEVGLCKSDGTVLYPSDAESKNLNVKIPENASYFYANGIGFAKCPVASGENRFLFIKENEEICGRLLNLAIIPFHEKNAEEALKKEDFIRKLILADGFEDPEEKSRKRAGNIKIQDNNRYAVICIRNMNANESLSENVPEIVKSIFPEDMGFETVLVNEDTIAVVATLHDESPYDEVTALADAVAETVLAEAMANVCVSMGREVSGIGKIHISYESALKYSEIGQAFGITEGCISEKKLGIATVLYNTPDEAITSFLAEVFGKLEQEDKGGRELIETVECFLSNNQNISETSRILYVHRNTLMYRIEKFNKITGLDCTKFDDGVKIRLAIMLFRYQNKKRQ